MAPVSRCMCDLPAKSLFAVFINLAQNLPEQETTRQSIFNILVSFLLSWIVIKIYTDDKEHHEN